MKAINMDLNKVYESNNYGSFMIIEDLKGNPKKVRIRFLNTGYENVVCYSAAIKGNIRDNSLQRITKNSVIIDFNKVYESNNYGPFIIIEKFKENPKKVRIKFINTGYENVVYYTEAKKGIVRDESLPYVRKDSVIIDFNKVYESNYYGQFMIMEDLGGEPKKVRIRFLNTGYENVVEYSAAIKGEVRDKSLPYVRKDSIIIDPNKIYESNNYGQFMIIEDLKGSPKKVRIRFINTGYENIVQYNSAIKGRVKDNSLPRINKNSINIDFNKVYESNNYGPFMIIEDLGGGPKKVRIRFINTGYESTVQYNSVIKGNIRDNSLPCIKSSIIVDFNKVYESNYYGPFMIIEDLGGGKSKKVRIRFINTGYENVVYHTEAKKGRVKDNSLPRITKNSIIIDFDKVYDSNNSGQFMIMEDLGENPKKVRIKFINTGYENVVQYNAAMKGEVRDNSFPCINKNSIIIDYNKVYESNNYGQFMIIEDLGGDPNKKVRIKFINTGYESTVQYVDAIKGRVKDNSLPRINKNSIIIDYNKVYESNNYGQFMIIEDLGGKTKKVRIRFINTGYENVVFYNSVIKGRVRDNSLPRITKNSVIVDFDKVYESNYSGQFMIIEDLGGGPKKVRIRFINTGYENVVYYGAAIKGEVRDNSIKNR